MKGKELLERLIGNYRPGFIYGSLQPFEGHVGINYYTKECFLGGMLGNCGLIDELARKKEFSFECLVQVIVPCQPTIVKKCHISFMGVKWGIVSHHETMGAGMCGGNVKFSFERCLFDGNEEYLETKEQS